MVDVGHLAEVVDELIQVLQLQARDLERLITHVEQVTHRMAEANELSVVRSELAALRIRMKKLRAAGQASSAEGRPGREHGGAEAKMPPADSGQPGGGRGRVDVTGIMPPGVRIDPNITEGHPGYEESGDSEIIPADRLGGTKAGEGKESSS